MITSIHNRRVVKAARLKKRAMREKDRRFLVEGSQAVMEALSSGAPVRELFYTSGADHKLEGVLDAARQAGVKVESVSEEVMGHLTSTVTPQGLVAVADYVDVPLEAIPAEHGCVPILVEVRDPGNAGTILRSADAAGATAAVFTRSSVDVYNEKTVRATAGSLFHVPVVRDVEARQAVAEFRQRGFAILASTASGEASVYEVDLTRPTAVLFGNEARGLPDEAVALADRTVRIPISGRAESLNLAAAATLVLFEAARQRAGGGGDQLAQIVAGAAHDIRSPLTAMKGFVSTMLSRWDRLTEEQRLAMLEGVAYDGNRMAVVVAQLVDAARLASGRLELATGPTDLLDAARAVRDEAGAWSTGQVDVSGSEARALADPARLRTILQALVEAAQWWGADGPVHVAVEPVDGRPAVSVWRSGSTLDEGAVDDLFRPRPPGTGGGSKVGLFVARGLVLAHGGDLSVTATPDVRFTLTLPPATPAAT